MKKFFLGILILGLGNCSFALDYFNPKPMDDDVIVSMPCNFKMAFRKVYTSIKEDKVQDASFKAGSADNPSPMSQNINQRYVQGGFQDKTGYYYLISKYELMRFQYDALKNPDKCPAVNKKSSLPAVNITYFDLLEVSRNYSLYLQKAQDTPTVEKEKAYVRLPTDSEWEFAQRGGLEVSTSEFLDNLPPVGENGLSDYAWYQGPNSSNGKLQLPGLKNPNPLNLYDMLGNASEMVLEPFQAVRTNRLLGQSGGLIVRGGSFKSAATSLSSATRSERPFYIKGHENKSSDLGARLCLAVSVASTTDAVKALNAQIEKLGESDYSSENESKQDRQKAMESLEKLRLQIAENKKTQGANSQLLEQNAKLEKQLKDLHQQINSANTKVDEQREKNILSNLRLGGFLCRSLAQQQIALLRLNSIYSLQKKSYENSDKDEQKKLLERYKQSEKAVKLAQTELDNLTTYFADTMAEASELYSQTSIEKLLPEAFKTLSKSQEKFIKVYGSELLEYKTKPKVRDSLYRLWQGKCFDLLKQK